MSATSTAASALDGTVRRRGVEADWAASVASAAIVVGAAIRLQQFLVRRSLWLDEALLANNIVGKGFGALLRPLDGNQAAPPGFLWIERSATLLFGHNEYALRLLPLAAGVAVVALTWLLGRVLMSRPCAALATVLVALSPQLLRYSSEVKQYETDAVIAVALVLLGLPLLRAPTRRRAVALGAAGSAAVWFSHPAILVLAALTVAAVVSTLPRRDWARLRVAAFALAPSALSFAVVYCVSLRLVHQNDALSAYWADGYPESAGDLLPWMWRSVRDFVEHVVSVPLWLPASLLAALGVRTLWREARDAAVVGLALIALLLSASTLELFPAAGRLLLFAVPLLLLSIAASIDGPRWQTITLGALVAVCAVAPARSTAETIRHPPLFADSRPVFEYVREHSGPSDQIILHSVTKPPFDFYAPGLDLHANAQTGWARAAACESLPRLGDAARAHGMQRVWVLFAYTLSFRPSNEADRVRSEFDAVAARVDQIDRADASATLYDFGAEPTVRTPPLRNADLACLRIVPIKTAVR